MLQKALVLLFVLASMAAYTGCGNTSSHYLYATIPVANQIVVYREDPNSGVLTQIAGSPYSVGEGARSLVLHPSGKYLYVANPGQGGTIENDLSLFDIAADGTLTEVTPRTVLGSSVSNPQLLLIDSAGSFLYVMNTGSSNISVFSIDSSSGALTQVPNSPFSIGALPLNMLLSPTGNFLFVSLAGQPNGLIATYSVTGGQLSLVNAVSSDGINPYGLATDAGGGHLYTGNNNGSSSSIAVFTIDGSGSLAEVGGSPINPGYSNPFALLFDPSGSFLYVADQGSNNIAAFSLDSNGLPLALTTSTTANAFGTESDPSVMVVDPAGKYMFVGNQGTSAGIQAFIISDGTLTALQTYNVGNTPSSIAILP